jgi:putative ABC transport system substrate-binding protein
MHNTKKSIISLALSAMLLALNCLADAQQPPKMTRVGFLAAEATIPSRIEALRQELRDLGYVLGQNLIMEFRSAEGKLERLPELAAELVRLNVDLIIVAGSTQEHWQPRTLLRQFLSFSWACLIQLKLAWLRA